MLEPGLELYPVTPVDWTGATGIPAGNSSQLSVAWRPDGLYFYFLIDDPERLTAGVAELPGCGDGAEIFVDSDGVYVAPPAYDDPGTRQFTIAAPVDDVTVSTWADIHVDGSSTGAWTSTQFGAFPLSTGYAVEAFISAADLALATWTLTAGASVGLDVSVNVSPTTDPGGACHRRLGQYFLSSLGGSRRPFVDVGSFCNTVLAP